MVALNSPKNYKKLKKIIKIKKGFFHTGSGRITAPGICLAACPASLALKKP